MADDLSERVTIAVHQIFHGYSEGHRELASSLRLSARDARTISILSDISSSGLKIPDTGYLTGYPLPDASFYVLARTWAAPEVPRPGAVWTHSLLIEFSDLAAIGELRALLQLHRQPDGSDTSWLHGYRTPLEIDPRALQHHTAPIGHIFEPRWSFPIEDWLLTLLASLYEQPTRRVVGVIPQIPVRLIEASVLSVWGQQWPRLRRSFKFCMATGSDRLIERSPFFDLQLIPESEQGHKSRFQGTVFIDDKSAPQGSEWIFHVLEDLRHPYVSGLREFLTTVGSSAMKGRASFIPLVKLHQQLSTQEITVEAAHSALHAMNIELDGRSVNAAAMLTRVCASSIECMDEDMQDYVLSHLDLLSPADFSSLAIRIGETVWNQSIARFLALLEKGGRSRQTAIEIIRKLVAHDLVNLLSQAPDLVRDVLHERPDLVRDAALWSSSEEVIEGALSLLNEDDHDLPMVLQAILSVDSAGLRRRCKQRFAPALLWEGVVLAAEAQMPSLSTALQVWIAALAIDTEALAEALVSANLRSRALLSVIARSVSPDAVPNAYGDDPWFIAWRHSSGDLDREASIYLDSYFFARALGTVSRSCAELVEVSFHEVYKAAEQNAMTTSAWSLIEGKLPQPGFWESWDRCKQLCYGVAQLYVRRRLPASSFALLGPRNDVFQVLVRAASKEWNGRDYLRAVGYALTSIQGSSAQERIRIVDKQLDSWI